MKQLQNKIWDSVASEVSFNLPVDIPKIKKHISKRSVILDYGCGYGRVCQKLSKLGYKYTSGFDTSEEMIKRGNRTYPHLFLKHNRKINLEYPDEHFDLIIICAVLTCVPNNITKQKIINEICRLLKTGGILHMVEFSNETGKTFKSSFGVEMEHQQPNKLRELVTSFTDEISYEVIKTKTLTGKNSEAMSYFGKKA